MIAGSSALANYAVTPISTTVHGAWEVVLVIVAALLLDCDCFSRSGETRGGVGRDSRP